jgi:hypothetical protein
MKTAMPTGLRNPRGLGSGLRLGRGTASLRAAFTLLEVMIAMSIFFIAIFTILDLVSSNIRSVQRLQKGQVDASMLIADLYQTNKLEEGIDNGDFGDIYPGYRWTREITQVLTNGMFQVEYLVNGPHGTQMDSHLTVLLWRPESKPGAAFSMGAAGAFGGGR